MKTHNIIWLACSAILAFLVLQGCAAPSYQARPLSIDAAEKMIVIIRDEATREGFHESMASWLRQNGYSYEIVPEGTSHDPSKITLEYFGYWRWDLALYLERAEISAFEGGQPVGKVEFHAPRSLNLNKFGEGEYRIEGMMDVLFKKITLAEANRRL